MTARLPAWGEKEHGHAEEQVGAHVDRHEK